MKIAKILLVLSCALVSGAQAQDYYEYIPWRGNDPFVFCTDGPPIDHCWKPLNPVTATWVPTCPPPARPNPVSLAAYIRICPRAMGQGAWVPDNDGTPTTSPYVH